MYLVQVIRHVILKIPGDYSDPLFFYVTCVHVIIIIIYLNRFRLVTKVPLKQVTWAGVKWSSVDDSKLLVGVYQYGLGNWECIKDDPNIGLSKKVCTYIYMYIYILYV